MTALAVRNERRIGIYIAERADGAVDAARHKFFRLVEGGERFF